MGQIRNQSRNLEILKNGIIMKILYGLWDAAKTVFWGIFIAVNTLEKR